MESGGLQPHPSGDGTSIFRTGDLARYHPDGVFVVLGRKDRMIKINGQRLEPAEIECVLRSIPSVDRAELIVHRPAAYPGRPRLVAFVVPRCASPTLVSDIRAELKRKLPAYMIPSRILLTESIPLLPGGKTDTLALVALAEGHMAAAAP